MLQASVRPAGHRPPTEASRCRRTALVGIERDRAHVRVAASSVKARSQWAYARMRFFRHKLAVVSLVDPHRASRFVGVFALADRARTASTSSTSTTSTGRRQLEGWHLFGTDQLGRDYLSRVIYGIRTSLWVALFVALLSTLIGTTIGAIAGYYGGMTDNLLMRFTDLILTLPGLAVLLTAAAFFGQEASTSASDGRSRSRS